MSKTTQAGALKATAALLENKDEIDKTDIVPEEAADAIAKAMYEKVHKVREGVTIERCMAETKCSREDAIVIMNRGVAYLEAIEQLCVAMAQMRSMTMFETIAGVVMAAMDSPVRMKMLTEILDMSKNIPPEQLRMANQLGRVLAEKAAGALKRERENDEKVPEGVSIH